MKFQPFFNNTPIHAAATNGFIEIVELLISNQRIDLNVRAILNAFIPNIISKSIVLNNISMTHFFYHISN